MPSARGLALVKALGIECKPLLVKPSAPVAYTFVHRCAGPGCAICAWIAARRQGGSK